MRFIKQFRAGFDKKTISNVLRLQMTTNIKIKNTPISLRLDPKVRSRLEKEASVSERSLSYVAQKAIVDFLEAQEIKKGVIKEALVLADKRRFISDEDMASWVDSWDSAKELQAPKAK
jgi:predicted transcriptional regulator